MPLFFLLNTLLSLYHTATCWSCTALHDWQLPLSSLSPFPPAEELSKLQGKPLTYVYVVVVVVIVVVIVEPIFDIQLYLDESAYLIQ